MSKSQVLIAGAGISGLVTGLSLHQLGVPFTIFEALRRPRRWDVAVTLLPDAMRELAALGIMPDDLEALGNKVTAQVFLGADGQVLHEVRHGQGAGFAWPQMTVHYGAFLALLRGLLIERAGKDVLRDGNKVRGFTNNRDGSVTAHVMRVDARMIEATGALLLACDGRHSAMRAEIHGEQRDVFWDQTIAWHGIAKTDWPFPPEQITTFGTSENFVTLWPLSAPKDGPTQVAWCATRRFGEGHAWQNSGWFKRVMPEDILAQIHLPQCDCFDASSLLERSESVFETPRVEYDPLRRWTEGRVALLGDAAHAMLANLCDGASQAVLDARALCAALHANGLNAKSLGAYEHARMSSVTERQRQGRTQGPRALLETIEALDATQATDLARVICEQQLRDTLGEGRSAQGLDPEALNCAPPMLAADALVPDTGAKNA